MNFFIKKREYKGGKKLVIEMHLLNVQIQWMTFIRILAIATQTGKEKF